MSHLLDKVIQAQKNGKVIGITSICSAHPWVLETALKGDGPVLIESTCNQVNQFGGYTGMMPKAFASFVRGIADQNGFPSSRLILGGDHLGPSPWQSEPAEVAMQKAIKLVDAYVNAGYTKIHLDASMQLGGDDLSKPLDRQLIAQRTAMLAKAALDCVDTDQTIRFVIGSEVPVPGGAIGLDEEIRVTTIDEANQTIEMTRAAFIDRGLQAAWDRVLAMVVQPGVEFGDDFIHAYDPGVAQGLAQFVENTPFIFEAHSTDYQSMECLQALVHDHFAILKVGPALTFAFREAVFALTMIEAELIEKEQRSHLVEILETVMLKEPHYWQKYYHGTEQELAFKRKFSLSDRSRYYWSHPEMQLALDILIRNLDNLIIPYSLIGQYLPDMVDGIHSGLIKSFSAEIINHRIRSVLDDYAFACG